MKLVLALLTCLIGVSTATLASAEDATTATAVLAGGCFWCMEHDMRQLAGVVDATAGYTGGSRPMPTYDNYFETSEGHPPHVEAVRVVYDPKKVSYQKVLDYYFHHIDPTDGDGQFCDRGASYRPVIFVANDAEKATAEAEKAAVRKQLKTRIEVEIAPAQTFWRAEEDHQQYAERNTFTYSFYRWNCGRDARVQEVWGMATN